LRPSGYSRLSGFLRLTGNGGMGGGFVTSEQPFADLAAPFSLFGLEYLAYGVHQFKYTAETTVLARFKCFV